MAIIRVPEMMSRFGNLSKMEVVAPVKIFSKVPTSGALDPSLAWDPLKKRVWMAYTSEDRTVTDIEALNVRLASADVKDGCKLWVRTEAGFNAKNDDILAPDGQTILRSGTWRTETPALVYDPDDHGREWKLYAYKYFWSNDPKSVMPVARHYGVIVYKYASDPEKEWSLEQWLFSPTEGYPPPPYEQMILLHLNRLDPSLQNVATYARPSVIYKDGALIMTLSVFTDGLTPDRIIMIISRDHGNSWVYAGTVLQKSDLTAPYTEIAGASLVEQEGQVYLAAALGNEQQRGQGTVIFSFEDLSKGLLQRDPKSGAPVVLNRIPLQNPNTGYIGGGTAAYSEACGRGIMQTEQVGSSQLFQIYQTITKPIEINPPGNK